MKQLLRLCGAAALTCATVPAIAAPAAPASYTANVIFGDSLSDNGNLADALKHNFPSPPFNHDSFTNGKVAVQVLDDRLGLSTNPSLFPTRGQDSYNLRLTAGTNYSVAGATAGNTGVGGVPDGNLVTQVAAFLAPAVGKASASNLYTFFIGGNDVRAAAHNGAPALVNAGVATELYAIAQVIAAGATNLLVVNVPDIGVIPETRLRYPTTAAAATQYTLDYNSALLNGVTVGQTVPLLGNATLATGTVLPGVNALRSANPNVSITFFDLYGFQQGLLADPGKYGLTDTTTPCYTSYGGVTDTNTAFTTSAACAANGSATGNIGHLAFWDAIHPTETVQAAIGNALADAIGAPAVPEPSSWATMLVGVGLMGAGLRRRRRAGAAAIAA